MRRRRRPSSPFDPPPQPEQPASPQPGPEQPPAAPPPPAAEEAVVEDVDGRPIVREAGRAAERDFRLLSDDETLQEEGHAPPAPAPEPQSEPTPSEEGVSLENLIDSLVDEEDDLQAPPPPPAQPAAGQSPAAQSPLAEPPAGGPAPAVGQPEAGAWRPDPSQLDALTPSDPLGAPAPERPDVAAPQPDAPAPAPGAEVPQPELSPQSPEEQPSEIPAPAPQTAEPQPPAYAADEEDDEIKPPPFVSDLDDDQDLWSAVFADDDEEEAEDEQTEASAPPAPPRPSLDFGEESGEHEQAAEPTAEQIAAFEAETQQAPQPEPQDAGPQPAPEPQIAPEPAPEPHQAEEPAAKPYMAVRTAALDGPNPLPLALDFDNDVDEINHALAAFSDLEHGQLGMIRFSIRSYPELKQDAREWLAARRTGENPQPTDAKSKIVAWGKWLVSRLMFEMTRKEGDKTPPPLRPGERGAKVKPASEFTTEEKESWKAAERKARDTAHFEVMLRVGVIGPQEEAERQVEEVAAGFEAFSTPFQTITWRPGDPYAALLGLMPARKPEELPMALCAEEIAGMAHVPDDQTMPHGVRVKRSFFKQLPPPSPMVVDDKMSPKGGLIPIGLINPDSEDEKVIGMNNAQLDQHAVVVGKTGSGKALALDTPIPTPQGLRRMGDLRVGDYVFGVDGRPTRIAGATEVMEGRPCYEVVFSDGERIVADANHLWVTRDAATRRSDSLFKARKRAPLPKWLSAVERLAEGEGLVSQRDAIDAGVPYHAVRDVARHIPPAKLEARVVEQNYGGTIVLKRTRPLPLYERAELCRALRRRAFDARRRQFEHRLQPQERTTADLAASARTSDGRANHSIDLPQPLQYPERELPVAPYTLGAWLGDGHGRRGQITTADEEVLEAIRAEGYEVRPAGEQAGKARTYTVLGLKAGLRELGLLRPDGAKRIPEEYFTASESQRWALLEGLLDTDGGVERGACRFYNTSRELAEDVRRLAFTLGLRPKLGAKPARFEGRELGTSYTLSFTCSRPLFRIARKRAAQQSAPRSQPRYIVEVNPVPSVPVRCIQVAAEDGMFLAGRTCVPTHNSVFLSWMAFGISKAAYPIVVVDPHGQFSDDILKMLLVNCPERLDDIVLCDLSDDQYPVAFNPLDVSHRTEVTATVNSVSEMLSSLMHLDSAGAPRATLFAKQALTALCFANLMLEDPETKCTLLDVIPFFQNEEFRRLIVEFCDNPVVQGNFDPDHGVFEKAGEKEQNNISMPIIRAFSQLGEDDSFAAVFSSPQNKLNLGKLVGEGKVVIIKLARFQNQAKLGEFVGSLILPWMLNSMDSWGRKKDPITGEVKGRGVRVLVDEAPALYGPESSVPKALAEARKWDLGLISIGQNLGQFPKNVAEALLANTASKFALASDPNVSGQIAKAVAGASNLITPADMAQLPNYHMYANILQPAPGGGVAASGPFSVRCLAPMDDSLTEEHQRQRQEVIQRSRQLVTNSIEDVRRIQQTHIDNIMRVLHQKLQERIDSGYNPPSVSDGGAVAFDPDEGWV